VANYKFQCCFCGQEIAPSPPDVASLTFTTCIDREPEMQYDQTNFCHTACFRERLHPSVKLYAVTLVDAKCRGELQEEWKPIGPVDPTE
jgi:hypothetical protein